MSFIGAGAVASGPASGLRFAQTRGRTNGSPINGVNYPSPFFDVAHTYLPVTFKQMFKWCRYYFLTNPLINATVFKLSEYPVTDIIIDHKDSKVKNRWTEYFQDHLRFNPFRVEFGLDYNCLAAGTRVVTEDGVVPIQELEGRTVRVLSEGGVYRPATFSCYGQQRLYEVHTEDGVILATEGHEWPVWSHAEKKVVRTTTKHLADKSVMRVVAPRPEKNEEFWEGARHGIVYGDGTLSNEGRQAHLILHTREKRYLARYFEGHCSAITPHHSDKYLGVYGLPAHYKEAPKENASASYWYGFTCGLLSTDGSVSKRDGCVILNQKTAQILLEISKRLPWFGLLGGRVREYWHWSNLTKQEEPCNTLNLKKQYMRAEDFIRPDQRATFEEHFRETGYGQFCSVQKVVPTDRVENVYCCVEKETHSFVVEQGLLTGNCYGNGFVSLGYPFKKYLYCQQCSFRDLAEKIRANWIFTNFQFRMTCPRCQYTGDALAKDLYYKNASGIRTIRWNPEDVEVTYNDISGECTYFYTIPAVVRNDVVIGRKDVVESIPQVFIQAMREQKGVIFSKDNFFHMRRPTLATQDRGWGIPLLLPVLKDTFYLQVMKKAQEAILLEHIVPLRILFPQAGSGSSDPYCLHYPTLVEANYGYKAAGDIVVGDLIKTASGRYEPIAVVKKRAVRPNEKVYQLTIAGMSAAPVSPSEDHPFLAVQTEGRIKSRVKDWTPEWVRAKELQVGDYVAYPVNREVHHGMRIDMAQYLESYVATDRWVYQQTTLEGAAAYEYAEAREQRAFANGELQQVAAAEGWKVSTLQSAASKYRRGHRTPRLPRYIEWSKDFATILGYYLAEGCVEETRITYALHREETWICDELDKAFKNLLGLTGTRTPHGANGLTYRINTSSFAEFLKNYGGHLAWNKKLPPECVHLPEEILLELVRCLINGDGGAEHAYRNNGTGRSCRTSSVTHTTTSLPLALKLRELLLYLGIIGRVHTTPVREWCKHPIHRVKVNGQMAIDLWKKLGWDYSSTVHVEKDTTRSFILGDYAYFRVQKKEELTGVDFVYGFQVDGDKSFCVPSCATHNTTINLVDWRDQVAAEIARWRYDCVAPDSFVETANGVEMAGNVHEGTFLKNHVGGFSLVEKIWRRPLRNGERAFQLIARGLHGAIPTVSEGHPFLVRRKKNEGNGHQAHLQSEFVRVKDINPGDYVGYPVHRTIVDTAVLDLPQFATENAATDKWIYVDYYSPETPEAFEYLEANGPSLDRQNLLMEKGWSVNQYKVAQVAHREGRTLRRLPREIPLDEELCWVVGLYLAEGSSSTKQVLFALHEDERPFMERLDRFFLKRFGATAFKHYITPGGKGLQYVFSSKLAAQFFGSLCEGVAVNKKIAPVLKALPKNKIAALLRGYFDGDGCYHKVDESHCSVSTASLQLANDVRELLLSVGILCGLSFSPPAPYDICGRTGMSNGHYTVAAHGQNRTKLLEFLSVQAESTPSYCRIGFIEDGYAWHRVEELREVALEEVIGFQMSREISVRLSDDTESHGTFCLWGMASANTNYIPIVPLPIGNQTIGGDGRALLLTQEIVTWSEQIMNGMGVPIEFIKGGMCLSPSSLVFTDRGLERLDEIAQGGATQRLTVTHKGLQFISQVHQPGAQKVVRVTTRSGLVLEGGKGHGALRLKEDLSQVFTALSDLRPGDHVGVHVGANLWPVQDVPLSVERTKTGRRFNRVDLPEVRLPDRMSKPLAKILGYLISEGACSKETELAFSSMDRELAEDFAACVEAAFGYLPSIREVPYETIRRASSTMYIVSITRQAAVELLQSLGAAGNSYDKSVPPCIRCGSIDTVKAFLQAYFDGDGGYSTVDAKACASAHSVSHRLLQEVQLLLLNMGIVSSLYEPVETKSTYTLQIRSFYATLFAEKVGFFCKRKTAKTEEVTRSRRAGNCSLSVPYLNDALRALKAKITNGVCGWKAETTSVDLSQENYTTAELALVFGRDSTSINGYIKKGMLRATWVEGESGRFGRFCISKADAEAFLREHGLGKRYALKTRQYEYSYDVLDQVDLSAVRTLDPVLFDRIEELKTQKFFWDEVVSIEELEYEEEMLDLGVEEVHSYQANGILCHNSYAGTNVSMRMMENMFLGTIQRHRQLARFMMKQVASFLDWPEATVRFKPFKMADDLQRKAFLFQLNQANKVSDTTLLGDNDFSQEDENEIMMRETDMRSAAAKKQQLAMANIQGEAQLVMMKYQAKAQQVMQEATAAGAAPGEPGGGAQGQQAGGASGAALAHGGSDGGAQDPSSTGGAPSQPQAGSGGETPANFLQQVSSQLQGSQRMSADGGANIDLPSLAMMQAKTIVLLPEAMQEVALQNIELQSPELGQMTRQLVQQEKAANKGGSKDGGSATTNAVDMRPLPAQRPPRRAVPGV